MSAVAGELSVADPATEARAGTGGGGAQALRDAFAHLPAGVSVVTSLGADGPVGMTASTVSSLSLDPPLLLFCAANGCRTLAQLRAYGRFAVNALPVSSTGIARAFAELEPTPGHRFRLAAHHVVDAVLVLTDALLVFTCAVQHTYPGGDHTIVVGQIRTVTNRGGPPLLWHARGYRQLTPLRPDTVNS